MGPIRVGLVVALLASFATAGRPDDPSPPAPPQEPLATPSLPPSGSAQAAAPVSFVIEQVVVEGVRGSSAKIVVSETLLTLGSAYTEAQLREALHRVERLPFVVEADFTLRRGSERGRFELVITVKQTWPVFFGGTLGLARENSAFRTADDTAVVQPEIGGRVFFGGYNEVSVTLGTQNAITRDAFGPDQDSSGVGAAYRYHNLFGRHVVGSVFFRRPRSGSREGGAAIAWPLSRASALVAAFTLDQWSSESGPTSWSPGWERRSTTGRLNLSWDRDTTDDPFAPRQGSRVGSTVSLSDYSGHSVDVYDPWNPGPYTVIPGTSQPTWSSDGEGGGISLGLAGHRYWPILRGASLGLGATVGVGRSSGDSVYAQGDTVRTLGQTGWGAEGTLEAEMVGVPRRLGRGATQMWWVMRASAWGIASRLDYDADPPLAFSRAETDASWARLSFGLSARGRWGIASLLLSYEYAFRQHAEYR